MNRMIKRYFFELYIPAYDKLNITDIDNIYTEIFHQECWIVDDRLRYLITSTQHFYHQFQGAYSRGDIHISGKEALIQYRYFHIYGHGILYENARLRGKVDL